MSKLLKTETGGYMALVDTEDYERCLEHKWYLANTGYFWSRTAGFLHHFLIGKPPVGFVTDHINQNKFHNLKSNLRHVTQAVNVANGKHILKQNYSIFEQAGKFRVRLTRDGIQIHVGYYDTIEKARAARDKYLKEHSPETMINL